MSAVHIPGITAPPSTAYKIVDVAENYKRRHRVATACRAPSSGPSMEESPWVPFGDKAAIRHLAFDTRHNTYGNILWIKKAGVVGTHKHRGTVVMVCLEGSARYLEYDWVAHPGDFIYETPGLVHTLVSDHPEGVKFFGWLQGATEFYDENGKLHRDARRVVVHQPLRDAIAASTASRSTSSSIYELSDAGASSAGSPTSGSPTGPTVGGKGGSLGELTRAGIAVPPGFVVRTACVRAISSRRSSARRRCARASRRSRRTISRPSRPARRALRARIESAELPADVRRGDRGRARALCAAIRQSPVAVRSSATHRGRERRELRRPAGHLSLGHDLRTRRSQRVRSCWASLYSVESISYRRQRGFAGRRRRDGRGRADAWWMRARRA